MANTAALPVVLAAALLVACSSQSPTTRAADQTETTVDPSSEPSTARLRYEEGVRAILEDSKGNLWFGSRHEGVGQTEARVGLAEVAGPRVIAVGALAGLEGEITILDGEVWIARPDGDGVRISGPSPSSGDQATLLTVASVTGWGRVALAMVEPATGAELEALIEQAARDRGVDTTRPFPFVIDGVAERLEIHVINGVCPYAADPANFDAEPWRWSADEPLNARIVGMYAAEAAGVLTHYGTSMHVHALIESDGRMLTGHIDGLTLKPGASLQLPADR